MYAVFDAGGRQHAVSVGDRILIDLKAGSEKDATITFDKVLVLQEGESSEVGAPTLDGVVVEAKVVEPLVKGTKLKVQKFRRRKGDSKSAQGHRQKYTRVEITRIGKA